MLDDFVEEQKISYQILKNTVIKNQISHAYLIETNNYEKKEIFALSLAKFFLCNQHYSNNKKCVNCTQCKNIEMNTFPELKIIRPDGLWIKKEQLDELQIEFSEISLQTKYRIYIIYEAEKMNQAAANSILKFLEDPVNQIIAILVTDNIYQMLNTIVSRCQIISLEKQNNFMELEIYDKIKSFSNFSNDMDKLELQKYIDTVIHFIIYYEKNGINTILNTQKLWHNIFKERDRVLLGLDIMILYYKDILNYRMNRKIEIFEFYLEDIKKNSFSIIKIINNIKTINDCKNKIKLNVNINLLIDKLIIDLEKSD